MVSTPHHRESSYQSDALLVGWQETTASPLAVEKLPFGCLSAPGSNPTLPDLPVLPHAPEASHSHLCLALGAHPALMFPPSPGQGTADPSTILASVIPPEQPKHFPVLRLHSAPARRTGYPHQGTDPILIFFRIRLFKLCFSVCEMLWLSSRLKQWLCPPLPHLAQVTTVIQDVILIY